MPYNKTINQSNLTRIQNNNIRELALFILLI